MSLRRRLVYQLCVCLWHVPKAGKGGEKSEGRKLLGNKIMSLTPIEENSRKVSFYYLTGQVEPEGGDPAVWRTEGAGGEGVWVEPV